MAFFNRGGVILGGGDSNFKKTDLKHGSNDTAQQSTTRSGLNPQLFCQKNERESIEQSWQGVSKAAPSKFNIHPV